MEAQEVAAAIKQAVEANKAELVELSHTIHEMPELSFEEHKTSALVEDFLERHDFSVERGTYDMSTAFTATYGSGPFNAVICAEYDALHQDPVLSEAWDAGLRGTGRVVDGTIEAGGGSTDMGNVSQVVPAIHPAIAILGSSASQHTYQFAKDAMTPAADQTCLDGAIALAQTVATAASGDNREHFLAQQRSRRPGSTKVPAGME